MPHSVTGTVADIEQVARRMRRIRLEGDEVSRLEWTPGQHVRVHVADMRDPRNWLRPRDMLRTYSVWRYDGGLELCVLDHGGDEGGEAAGGAGPVSGDRQDRSSSISAARLLVLSVESARSWSLR